jgi:hypothetical protein
MEALVYTGPVGVYVKSDCKPFMVSRPLTYGSRACLRRPPCKKLGVEHHAVGPLTARSETNAPPLSHGQAYASGVLDMDCLNDASDPATCKDNV